MGKIYESADKYIVDIPNSNVVVEIGSERGEGSTRYFADLAKKYNTVLYSVDVSTEASETLHLDNVHWCIELGSTWAKNYNTIGKTISVLYLDNFDYIWNSNFRDSTARSSWNEKTYNELKGPDWPQQYVEYDQLPDFVKKELSEELNVSYDAMMETMRDNYAKHGMTLRNSECQLEHFQQLYHLKDWLAEECVVIFDDTFRVNDCWLGKNAGGVLLLQTLGFTIVEESSREKGLILKR